MKQIKKHIIFILCIICLVNIFNFKPYIVYADVMSADDIKNNENANLLWDYIVGNGGTEFWAAAAVANAYSEHGLKTDLEVKNNYWGAFQFSNKENSLDSFKTWCTQNKYETTSIVAQYEYLISVYRKSCCKSLTGIDATEIATNTELIKSCTDAAAYFALGMEGCICYKEITTGKGDIVHEKSFKHTEDGTKCASYVFTQSDYGTVCLQNLIGRSKNTQAVYSALSGKPVSENYSIDTSAALTDINASGLLPESDLAQIYTLLESNWETQINSISRDNLDVQDLEQLSDWELMANQNDTSLINFMRKLIAVLGVLLILWGILLYLAYWFDTINTLVPFQFVPMLSFGKLEVLNEEETTFSLAGDRDNTKRVTVNHKNILTVCILLIGAGVFILTGFIYTIIGALYHKIKSFY